MSIIVNYNTRDRTLECIGSVLRSAPPRAIGSILVDNGSTDGSVEAIAEAYPEVLLVDVGENVGFARGVNRGVRCRPWRVRPAPEPRRDRLPRVARGPAPSFAIAASRARRLRRAHGAGGRVAGPLLVLGRSHACGRCSASRAGSSTVFRSSSLFDPESLGEWRRDSVREVPIVTGCLLLARRRGLGAARRDGRALLPLRRGRRILRARLEARIQAGDRAGCGHPARRGGTRPNPAAARWRWSWRAR